MLLLFRMMLSSRERQKQKRKKEREVKLEWSKLIKA
jgi:hypothetical protein